MESERAKPPPTLSHVAKLAGVSRSTASLVLSNGDRPVSEETRRRVEAAAASLGYRSNPVARSLRTGTSRLVAVVMDMNIGEANPRAVPIFIYRFLLGLMAGLSNESIGLVLVTHETPLAVSSLPADAILLLTTDPGFLPERALPAGVPIVAIGEHSDLPNVRALVRHDHPQIARDACNHLMEAGGQRIAIIPRADPQNYVAANLTGYLQWCQDTGHEPIIVETDGTPNGIREAVRDAALTDVDAFYSCSGDTLSVLDGIAESGKTIPEDVMVVALAEGVLEGIVKPSITVISMDGSASAKAIADILRTVSINQELQHAVMEHKLLPGDSTQR